MPRLPLRAGVRSDPGLERDHNEDTYFSRPELGLFAVIDGVGGHNAGEVAAEIAREQVEARLSRPEGTLEEALREGITIANNEIFRQAEARRELQGMACVLSAVVVESGQLTIGHVGDSRVYRIHRGRIEKLTHDHSPIGEREDQGELTELEAMRHLRRNEVYRDVGSEPHGPEDPDFIEIVHAPFDPDAALVICSDGLSDLVTRAQTLELVMAHAGDPARTANELVEKALAEGGKDNVTVIVVEGPDFGRVQYPPRREETTRRMGTTARASNGQLISLPSPPPRSPGSAGPAGPDQAVRRRPGWIAAVAGLVVAAAIMTAWLFGVGREKPKTPVDPAPQPWDTVRVDPGERSLKIADALAAAAPGQIILVAPGTYNEDELRLRSGVTVLSEQPGAAVIVSEALPGRPAVSAEAVRRAAFIGFTVRAGREVGIDVRDAEVQLLDLRIDGTRQTAVRAAGPERILLWNVRARPEAGAVLDDAAAPNLVKSGVIDESRGAAPEPDDAPGPDIGPEPVPPARGAGAGGALLQSPAKPAGAPASHSAKPGSATSTQGVKPGSGTGGGKSGGSVATGGKTGGSTATGKTGNTTASGGGKTGGIPSASGPKPARTR